MAYMNECAYVCLCVQACVCMHVCMCVGIRGCVYTCIAYVFLCVYDYVYHSVSLLTSSERCYSASLLPPVVHQKAVSSCRSFIIRLDNTAATSKVLVVDLGNRKSRDGA